MPLEISDHELHFTSFGKTTHAIEEMSPSMRLTKIPHHLTVENEDAYNSNFHTWEECPTLLQPNDSPQNFYHWLALVAQSQHIPLSQVQSVSITVRQCQL